MSLHSWVVTSAIFPTIHQNGPQNGRQGHPIVNLRPFHRRFSAFSVSLEVSVTGIFPCPENVNFSDIYKFCGVKW
jgi:hypothetical protein